LAEAQIKGAKVEYRGIVPYLELGRVLADFDVGVTLYRGKRLNEQYCAPGKMYQYIAARLACVLPAFPGPQRLVDQYGFAVMVNPTSPASIAAEFRRLQDTVLLEALKNKALQAFENALNYETQSRNLVNYIVSECHRHHETER
jgi:glycosyltransferase involved in cell wall biosynthesis